MPAVRFSSHAVGVFTLLAVTVAACSGSGSPVEPQTRSIDCVAVLGIPPPSSQLLLAGVPYSGVQRGKLIGKLTDSELGRLCDANVCLATNGYQRKCYDFRTPEFRLETVAILAEALYTCYPTMDDVPTPDDWGSRENCMALFRRYFSTCYVATVEDCSREGAATPFGAWTWRPHCAIMAQQCPIN